MRHGGPHGHGRHGHGDDDGSKPGAQTFRRGRALAFLESLNVKRLTLASQLEQPEMQEIRPTIVGELKAIDMVRNEFIAMFDLHECTDHQGNPARGESAHSKGVETLTGQPDRTPGHTGHTAASTDITDTAASPDTTTGHSDDPPGANPLT